MAFEGQQFKILGAVSGGDLSAASAQYKFVKFNATDKQVVLCTALTDKPCGVLQAPTPTSATGQPVEVVWMGQTKVQSDGSVNSADTICPDANGRAHTILHGTDTTKFACGQCISKDGATAAGDYVSVFIDCGAPTRAA